MLLFANPAAVCFRDDVSPANWPSKPNDEGKLYTAPSKATTPVYRPSLFHRGIGTQVSALASGDAPNVQGRVSFTSASSDGRVFGVGTWLLQSQIELGVRGIVGDKKRLRVCDNDFI